MNTRLNRGRQANLLSCYFRKHNALSLAQGTIIHVYYKLLNYKICKGRLKCVLFYLNDLTYKILLLNQILHHGHQCLWSLFASVAVQSVALVVWPLLPAPFFAALAPVGEWNIHFEHFLLRTQSHHPRFFGSFWRCLQQIRSIFFRGHAFHGFLSDFFSCLFIIWLFLVFGGKTIFFLT